MPYIKPEGRTALRRQEAFPKTAGELNFVITDAIDDWLLEHGVSYDHINMVVGALECAKLEFYARIARPYEEIKRRENGDVYSESVLEELA